MSELNNILACPRCDSPLQDLRCPACRVDFPVLDGVPWLFADPEATRTDWRNRWNMALGQLDEQQQKTTRALEQADSATAQRRLKTLATGYAQQGNAVKALLASLELGEIADQSTYLALKTRLPTAVGLLSYTANVFRDWCWGDRENTAALEAIRDLICDVSPQRVLVLGAGASRLAYDLHQALAARLTVALDANPYLTTIAHKLTQGEVLDLTEFPVAPKDGARAALQRHLRAPRPARTGFHVVLANALRAPFRTGAFDLVVTPWLIDVIDSSPGDFISRLNPLLAENGCWINQGSLAFERPDPAECPDLTELTELAEARGFGHVTSTERSMPYMDCPDSRHGRREQVVTLSAIKVSNIEPATRQQSLPDWIARGRQPIPLLPAFQTQAMTTRMHAFIMTLIDGQRSLQDLAGIFEEQQLMPKAEAEAAIRGFLIKMFDEAAQTG